LSEVKAREGDNWSSGWDMGRDVMAQIHQPHYGSMEEDKGLATESALADWLLYPAYAILCLASIYLVTSAWLQLLLLTRARRLTRGDAPTLLAGITHGLLSRLPELDVAWTMWRLWVQDLSNQMTVSAVSGNGLSPKNAIKANGTHVIGSAGNGNSHNRKRNKSKKRN
jgi:hypothetical protein